ncbi:hypothetical protein CR513_39042, partial [Mucuna pruriens]
IARPVRRTDERVGLIYRLDGRIDEPFFQTRTLAPTVGQVKLISPSQGKKTANNDELIMPITRNQASSTNEGEEDMLQRLLRTVAQLQARSDEHSRLSAEAETRHRLAKEHHAEAMKMAEQREEELRRRIASLKARDEQEQEVRGEHVAQPLWKQPFCEEIDEARVPLHFREISVDPFNGTQDPHAHLQAFQTQMYISRGNDKLSCKLFLGTLRGVAL